ncbi:MAG: SDR family oxidoreductase [Anaerolineae bacterium]|nr:SDR family oxidoreductase [Anaerolineae bacterium]
MADKIAVITGAGSGMGRAIAHKMAANGVHVVLTGRTQSKLDSVAGEVAAAGGSALVHPLDVTDPDQIQILANRLASGQVDMLINCAGDWLIKSVDDTTPEDLNHLFAINLRGPYLMTQALLPLLRKSANASVINIGSVTSMESHPMVTAYTAMKSGLRGLSGSLAAELKPDEIRVILLAPGPADTPMRDAASPGVDKSTLVPAETIAEMVWTLVSLPRGITTSDFLLTSLRYGG